MYKAIATNKRNTILIMMGFVVLISIIGAGFAWYFDDWSVLIYVFSISAVYAVFQYFIAGSLAVMMAGAKEITKKDNPRLYNIVENLSITAGLPMPKVYVINDDAPNAFATGRDPQHASVAATSGLLDIMDDKELTAVMGHEMSHVKNYDIRVSTIVFGLVALIGFISDLGFRMLYYGGRRDRDDNDRSPVGMIIILVFSILAPLLASLAQMAVSRQREYLADASSVNLTRYPEGMISALKKLDSHARPMKSQNAAMEALYISNPLRKGTLTNLFSTHPPIEKRIERLEDGKNKF
ncbi:MAG: zinc metalloprotease HtpX [Candidatus Saccharibacteria bacterium]|nr:zinc metalloprotease HtpX [Candidatus Saccharibacteria bacterium]